MYEARAQNVADLGLALQQARLASGITQRELATRLGTSQRYIWELESGKPFPAIVRLLAALQATGAEVIVRVPEEERTDG